MISLQTPPDEKGIPYLDAGITKWNLRPRKLSGEKYLQTIEIDSPPLNRLKIVDSMSPEEQSAKYKYILNLDGHVTAYRLSLELAMGSVVLLQQSKWKIWYSYKLNPYEHYVPVNEDLSNLIDQIKWCRNNDEKCKEIAKNGRKFYEKYLQKDGIFDFMQTQLVNVKKFIGTYLYNISTPIQIQLENEKVILDKQLELGNGGDRRGGEAKEISQSRQYGILGAIHFLINSSNFESIATKGEERFRNNSGYITEWKLGGRSFLVKTTSDISKYKEHLHEVFIAKTGTNSACPPELVPCPPGNCTE